MKRLYPNLTAVFITAMLMFSGHSEAQELQQDTLRKNGVVNYDASDRRIRLLRPWASSIVILSPRLPMGAP